MIKKFMIAQAIHKYSSFVFFFGIELCAFIFVDEALIKKTLIIRHIYLETTYTVQKVQLLFSEFNLNFYRTQSKACQENFKNPRGNQKYLWLSSSILIDEVDFVIFEMITRLYTSNRFVTLISKVSDFSKIQIDGKQIINHSKKKKRFLNFEQILMHTYE